MCAIIGTWLYLFMFGKPQNKEDVYARFGFGEQSQPITENTQNTQVTPVVTETTQRLRKISERFIAGAHITDDVVYYMEQGTGHLYKQNLTSHEETLVDGTTISGAVRVVYSPNNTSIAVTTYHNDSFQTIIKDLTHPDTSPMIMPATAHDFYFETDEKVFYINKYKNGSVGLLFNIKDKTNTKIFDIPLRDIRMVWGDKKYVYTTPSETQIGYVYTIDKNGSLTYITKGMVGLSVFPYNTGIITSSITSKTQEVYAYTSLGEIVPQSLPYISEKCTANPAQKTAVFCAVPDKIQGWFPDDWYMGKISYNDTLWEMYPETGEAIRILNFQDEADIKIDVARIYSNETGSKLIILNKTDNTLWLYTP